MDIVRFFVTELDIDPNTPTTGEKGLRPIHLAAKGGHLELVKYLIEELHCDVNSKSGSNNTPLVFAAYQKHLNVMHYLIEKKADPSSRDTHGNTVLHYAALLNSLEVVKILAGITNPSTTNIFNKTPLKIAMEKNFFLVSLFLLRRSIKQGLILFVLLLIFPHSSLVTFTGLHSHLRPTHLNSFGTNGGKPHAKINHLPYL